MSYVHPSRRVTYQMMCEEEKPRRDKRPDEKRIERTSGIVTKLGAEGVW